MAARQRVVGLLFALTFALAEALAFRVLFLRRALHDTSLWGKGVRGTFDRSILSLRVRLLRSPD